MGKRIGMVMGERDGGGGERHFIQWDSNGGIHIVEPTPRGGGGGPALPYMCGELGVPCAWLEVDGCDGRIGIRLDDAARLEVAQDDRLDLEQRLIG